VLTANTMATVTGENLWTFAPPGAIDQVNPTSGQIGTRVTITGTRLRGAGQEVVSVTLDGVEVDSITSENDTVVEVVAARGNASSGLGPVTLVANTGAIVTHLTKFAYVVEGVVTSVSPRVGQVGTHITIHGVGMLGGDANIYSVHLDGVAALILNSSDTEIIVAAGPLLNESGVPGTVLITSMSGSVVTEEAAFTYLSQGEIDLVSPTRGQFGTEVAIFGENLLGGGQTIQSLTLNGVEVLDYSLVSNTTIKIRAQHSDNLGIGDIVIVSNTQAIVRKDNGWTYDVPSTITSVCT